MAHGGHTARTPDPATASHAGGSSASTAALRAAAGDAAPRAARLRAHLVAWRPVYLAFALSRLLVVVAGFGAEAAMRLRGVDDATWRPFAHAETFPHYADVATNGYTLQNAFDYPLLPSLMAAGQAIGIPLAATAFLVSNACLLVGLVGLAMIGERHVGRPAAIRAAVYLAIAPFAYWFSVASTESLLLALVVGATLLALRGTPLAWLGAGLLAGAAALSRPPGVLLGLVLLCIAIAQLASGRMRGRSLAAALTAGACIPLAVAAFFLYLRSATGDAFAALHAQDQFNRELSLDGPLRAMSSGIANTLAGSPGQAVEVMATFGAAALVAWFAATAAGNRWELRGWTLFAVASLLLPLATGVLWQMPRFALLVPPVFWALGQLGEHRWLHRAVLVLFPLGLAVTTIMAVVGVEG